MKDEQRAERVGSVWERNEMEEQLPMGDFTRRVPVGKKKRGARCPVRCLPTPALEIRTKER